MAEAVQIEQRSLVCPVCSSLVTEGRSSCPACEEDLTGLALLDDMAPSHYNEALKRVRQGKLHQATEHLQAALALDPSHIPALVVLGKVNAQQEHYEQAIGYWRRALELDPENAGAVAGIAKAQGLRIRQRRSRWLRSGIVLAAVAVLALLAALLGVRIHRVEQELLAKASSATMVPLATAEPTATREPVVPTPTQELQLADPVLAALGSDPRVAVLAVDVRQAGPVIQLSGEVPNQDLKTMAEKLAKSVQGVEAVDSTNLLVIPPALVEKAQEALRADPDTRAIDLLIAQVGSSLRLSGSAPSPEVKNQIISIVRSVEGVELVDAEGISVIAPQLAAGVMEAFLADSSLAPLALEVEQVGVGIRLKGSVPDADLKLQAEALARGVEGVELVDVGQVEVKPVASEYIVRPGDSLVSIARRFYGDGSKWSIIFEANRDIIAQPALIRVGMRLVVPPLP